MSSEEKMGSRYNQTPWTSSRGKIGQLPRGMCWNLYRWLMGLCCPSLFKVTYSHGHATLSYRDDWYIYIIYLQHHFHQWLAMPQKKLANTEGKATFFSADDGLWIILLAWSMERTSIYSQPVCVVTSLEIGNGNHGSCHGITIARWKRRWPKWSFFQKVSKWLLCFVSMKDFRHITSLVQPGGFVISGVPNGFLHSNDYTLMTPCIILYHQRISNKLTSQNPRNLQHEKTTKISRDSDLPPIWIHCSTIWSHEFTVSEPLKNSPFWAPWVQDLHPNVHDLLDSLVVFPMYINAANLRMSIL